MDTIAKVQDSVGKQILRAMITELSVQSPRYQSLPEADQNEVIERMRDAVRDAINHAVHEIAAHSYEALPVNLIKAQVKEGIQFQVNVIETPASSDWVGRVGHEAMLVFCDPTAFSLDLDSFHAPKKQRDAFDEDA